MKILGVCGGIGSGKSTACKLMVDALGCADRIGELAFYEIVSSVFAKKI
jgi:dephospho-CoA kinase